MSNISLDKTYAELQPLAVPFQVQCDNSQLLAYLDQEGNWRDYHSGQPLFGTVRVVEYKFD